jgi:hypothetical protein
LRISPSPSTQEWETLLCTRASWKWREGSAPGVEDGTYDEALVGADRLSKGAALGPASSDVLPCGLVPAALRERDTVEDGVELAVGAPIEPVAHRTRGRSLDRSGGSESGELGIRDEAASGAKLGGDSAGREQSNARDLSKGSVVLGREGLDLTGKKSHVCVAGEQPGDETPDGREDGRVAWGRGTRETVHERRKRARGSKRRDDPPQIKKERMKLIPRPRHLGEEGIAFGDKDIKDGGSVIGQDAWEVAAITDEDLGNGPCIVAIGLMLPASGITESGGPTRVAVEDREALGKQEASERPAEGESAFNGDLGRSRREGPKPVKERRKRRRCITTGERSNNLGVRIEGDSREDVLVRIDTDGKQRQTPLG